MQAEAVQVLSMAAANLNTGLRNQGGVPLGIPLVVHPGVRQGSNQEP
jgi:hypothetical protein